MTGGNGKHGSATSREDEKRRLWELFARTGSLRALRALRELERQEEGAAALSGASAA
jgi:hypothetical protein